MIRYFLFGIIGLGTAILLPSSSWNSSTPLVEVLADLGNSTAVDRQARIGELDTSTIRRGYDIVHRGFTVDTNGDTSQPVSRFFVCTDCHNTVIEDPDLRVSNPETRLDFAAAQQIPFLQGTTLQGVVNRETWYNGDYAAKYGERAQAAHNDLHKAIQLCAQECSQGRLLEDWELQAILAYLHSISYTLGDLKLSDTTWRHLQSAQESTDPDVRHAMVAELKSYYLHASPATFTETPGDVADGYGIIGNPQRGEHIYRLSCMHCHKPGGVARFELDDDALSFKRLKAKITKTGESGLYPAIRHGLSASSKRPKYMPLYPVERLSDRQIEDIRAYVEEAYRQLN